MNLGKGPVSGDSQIRQCFKASENLTHQDGNMKYTPSQVDTLLCGPKRTCPLPNGEYYDETEYYPQIHGSPVVWTQTPGKYRIYIQGMYDKVRAFQYDSGSFKDQNGTPLPCPSGESASAAAPIDSSSEIAPSDTSPGGILSLSSNGQKPGSVILWVSLPIGGQGNAEDQGSHKITGVLRAYDAEKLKARLWEETLDADSYAKFVPPTIADGKVYMAEHGRIAVFGLKAN
jgi:hypothetical protein